MKLPTKWTYNTVHDDMLATCADQILQHVHKSLGFEAQYFPLEGGCYNPSHPTVAVALQSKALKFSSVQFIGLHYILITIDDLQKETK